MTSIKKCNKRQISLSGSVGEVKTTVTNPQEITPEQQIEMKSFKNQRTNRKDHSDCLQWRYALFN